MKIHKPAPVPPQAKPEEYVVLDAPTDVTGVTSDDGVFYPVVSGKVRAPKTLAQELTSKHGFKQGADVTGLPSAIAKGPEGK